MAAAPFWTTLELLEEEGSPDSAGRARLRWDEGVCVLAIGRSGQAWVFLLLDCAPAIN